MSLVVPAPLPDELDRGYLGRIVRLNGVRAGTIKRAQLAIRPLLGSRAAKSSALNLLATISGSSAPGFVAAHTLERWRRVVTRPERIGASEQARLMTPMRPTAACCPACVEEDLDFHGTSYWRRTHQLLGATRCEKHERPLVCVNDVESFLKAPSREIGHGVEMIERDKESIEYRFQSLFTELGNSGTSIDATVVLRRLVRRAKARCDRLGGTDNEKSLIHQLQLQCDNEWLNEVAPAFNRREGEQQYAVMKRFLSSYKLPAPSYYVLLATLLCDDDQESLRFFNATRPTSGTSAGTRALGVSLDELENEFVRQGGKVDAVARELGISVSGARTQLASMGLIEMDDALMKAARHLLIGGLSLSDSVASANISEQEMLTFLRAACEPLARILGRMQVIQTA